MGLRCSGFEEEEPGQMRHPCKLLGVLRVSSGYDCHAAGRNRADPWRLHGRHHWGASQEEDQPPVLRLDMPDSGERFWVGGVGEGCTCVKCCYPFSLETSALVVLVQYLSLSLPCHLKTTNESAKFQFLKPFCCLFRISMWKDFHQNAQHWN